MGGTKDVWDGRLTGKWFVNDECSMVFSRE